MYCEIFEVVAVQYTLSSKTKKPNPFVPPPLRSAAFSNPPATQKVLCIAGGRYLGHMAEKVSKPTALISKLLITCIWFNWFVITKAQITIQLCLGQAVWLSAAIAHLLHVF